MVVSENKDFFAEERNIKNSSIFLICICHYVRAMKASEFQPYSY